MRILLAEDHENTAETYRLILEAEGHDVLVTSNGADCISMYNQYLNCRQPFDVVILDYRLPIRDGIEIAKHVLSLTPDQRILMASSYPEDVITRSAECLNREVEFLVKPFDITELADVVGKAKIAPLIGVRI